MLGLFGMFGRSRVLQNLDEALRSAGVHPRQVPEAVKLAAIKIVRGSHAAVLEQHTAAAAELLAYCMLGAEPFAAQTSAERTAAVEARMDAAVAVGDSEDAQLVLLTLHAGLTQPSVVEHFGLRVT